MKSKANVTAAILSLFAALQFLYVWCSMLFYEHPEFDDIWVQVWTIAPQLISSENELGGFFQSTLASIATSLLCSFLFWLTEYGKWIMLVVIAHTALATFVYATTSVFIIAMPLLISPYYLLMSVRNV